MKFSIIVPTYNRAYILWKTLLSIQNQTCDDFECIVIDDGSNDNTEWLVNGFDDERIKYFHQSKQGVAAARQLGMRYAQGEIITYIDSDDPVRKNYLQVANAVFSNSNKISFCISNCDFYVDLVDSKNKLLDKKHIVTHQEPINLHDIIHWAKKVALGTGLFFKRCKFENEVAWNKDLNCFEDLEFVMQLAKVDPTGYAFILESLFEYHQKYGLDGACSKMNYLEWSFSFEKLLKLHLDHPLLKNRDAYLARIKKYEQRHALYCDGQYIAPHLKYFPEFQ